MKRGKLRIRHNTNTKVIAWQQGHRSQGIDTMYEEWMLEERKEWMREWINYSLQVNRITLKSSLCQNCAKRSLQNIFARCSTHLHKNVSVTSYQDLQCAFFFNFLLLFLSLQHICRKYRQHLKVLACFICFNVISRTTNISDPVIHASKICHIKQISLPLAPYDMAVMKNKLSSPCNETMKMT